MGSADGGLGCAVTPRIGVSVHRRVGPGRAGGSGVAPRRLLRPPLRWVRGGALLALLLLLPAAPAAAPPCPAGEYQRTPLVADCAGSSGSLDFDLLRDQPVLIASFPAGASDVRITVSADVALDIQIVDDLSGTCLVGKGCVNSSACTSESIYCIRSEGMHFYFSGDDPDAPAMEAVAVAGELRRPLSVAARAGAAARGTANYSYGAISPCPAVWPGCAPCGSYPSCSELEQPQCDGSLAVQCMPLVTTTTTGTATSTSAGLCTADQYLMPQQLLTGCAAGAGSVAVTVREGWTSVGVLPAGLTNVRVQLISGSLAHLQLRDWETGACAVGHGCAAELMCFMETNFCNIYSGMLFYFSGPSNAAPIYEVIAVSGALTKPMIVSVSGSSAGTAIVDLDHGQTSPCPAVAPGCAACSSHAGCGPWEAPSCDGGPAVACRPVDTTTGTSTGTTRTMTISTTTPFATTTTGITTTAGRGERGNNLTANGTGHNTTHSTGSQDYSSSRTSGGNTSSPTTTTTLTATTTHTIILMTSSTSPQTDETANVTGTIPPTAIVAASNSITVPAALESGSEDNTASAGIIFLVVIGVCILAGICLVCVLKIVRWRNASDAVMPEAAALNRPKPQDPSVRPDCETKRAVMPVDPDPAEQRGSPAQAHDAGPALVPVGGQSGHDSRRLPDTDDEHRDRAPIVKLQSEPAKVGVPTQLSSSEAAVRDRRCKTVGGGSTLPQPLKLLSQPANPPDRFVPPNEVRAVSPPRQEELQSRLAPKYGNGKPHIDQTASQPRVPGPSQPQTTPVPLSPPMPTFETKRCLSPGHAPGEPHSDPGAGPPSPGKLLSRLTPLASPPPTPAKLHGQLASALADNGCPDNLAGAAPPTKIPFSGIRELQLPPRSKSRDETVLSQPLSSTASCSKISSPPFASSNNSTSPTESGFAPLSSLVGQYPFEPSTPQPSTEDADPTKSEQADSPSLDDSAKPPPLSELSDASHREADLARLVPPPPLLEPALPASVVPPPPLLPDDCGPSGRAAAPLLS